MILGPNPDATYSFGVEEIDPGDVLVLFTDGITEANDEALSGEYGHDRLVRAIRAARHLDPLAIVDRICAEVDTFSAVSPPADDQTLVVVKRRASKPEEIPA
jgi:serine phosphatase RsbU (regulator of sigma subunit)